MSVDCRHLDLSIINNVEYGVQHVQMEFFRVQNVGPRVMFDALYPE